MQSFEQIDAYLEAELSEAEREVFEAEMAQNPPLAYAVRLAQFNRRNRQQAPAQSHRAFLRRLAQVRPKWLSPPSELSD